MSSVLNHGKDYRNQQLGHEKPYQEKASHRMVDEIRTIYETKKKQGEQLFIYFNPTIASHMNRITIYHNPYVAIRAAAASLDWV